MSVEDCREQHRTIIATVRRLSCNAGCEHNSECEQGKIESYLMDVLADYAAKVRLDEARLWNVWVANPFESIDHEYHVGFNARCGLCRAKHIAELERSAKP